MVSIVMTYHNRREQFLRTLKSIKYFGDPEIIVVDDASDEDQRLEDVKGIILIRIDPENKKWANTCIPYNIGLAKAKGSVIIIQNAECVHTGDILSYCNKLRKGVMFSFGAYSLDVDLPFTAADMDVRALRPLVMKEPQRIQIAHHGWYNHSKHRPVAYHFCNALMREDVEAIGGFDERYANGLAHEDDEFLTRIKRSGIDVQIIDDPFVIHQKHKRTDYGPHTKEIYKANEDFFNGVTKPGLFVRAPNNNHYTKFNNSATTTHIPLIKLVLNFFLPKFILELGIGWYSTIPFRDHCLTHPDCKYLGIENEKNWIADIKTSCPQLNIIHHDLENALITMMWKDLSQYMKDSITDYYSSLAVPDNKPRLLFIDNYGSCRVTAFNILKDKFDFIIIHDCELAGAFLYSYNQLDTTDFNVYYLKNNKSWTALMIRKGIETGDLQERIKPLIAEHETTYPEIKDMVLCQNYL